MTIFTKERKLLLAVESSCDETSVAVIEDGDKILSNIVASSDKVSQRFFLAKIRVSSIKERPKPKPWYAVWTATFVMCASVP